MRVLEEDICCTKTRIFIGRNSVDVLRNYIDRKVLLLRQRVVDPSRVLYFLRDRDVYEVVLEGGERDKDISNVMNVVRILYERGFQRRDYVVAVGGGSLTDVAGFAASIYLRGLNYVSIPTTLLGMVDAAIGGKNGVNLGDIKNVLGTFYQPSIIVSDLGFLDTLPTDEMINGMAEVIKYAIIMDRDLYTVLEDGYREFFDRDDGVIEDIIFRSSINKLSIVKQDPYELKGVRSVLNFGHTIGHAIEATSRFGISHGKAVAVGMVCESMLGIELGVSPRDVLNHITHLLKLYRLPISVKELGTEINRELAYNAILRDKKAQGSKILMPLPIDLGKWDLFKVDMEFVKEVFVRCLG